MTNDERTHTFDRLSAFETETTISILGERGSGKTTLLELACHHLLSEGSDLVLPIIRPERFAPGDTLMGWIIASLQKVLEIDRPDVLDFQVADTPFPATLGVQLQRFKLQEALIYRGYGGSLPEQTLSASDFARDASDLNSAGATFASNWSDLVTTLLSILFPLDRRERPPLLVVPIDDADLRIELLPQIFIDIRRLSSHPAVAVVFCASLEAVETALVTRLYGTQGRSGAQENGSANEVASGHRVRETVHRQVVKALPYHLRIYLSGLTQLDRLHFHPIHSEIEIVELLREIRLDGRVLPMSIAEYMVLDSSLEGRVAADAEVVSQYADILPETPRELVQLHAKLLQVLGSGGERSYAGSDDAIVAMVDVCLDYLMPLLPVGVHGAVKWGEKGGRTGPLLDMRGVEFGSQLAGGVHVRAGDLSGSRWLVRARRHHSFRTYDGTGVGVSTDVDEGSERPPFNSAFTSAILFINDLIEDDVLPSVGMYGTIPGPGGTSWSNYLNVQFEGEDCDNAFWFTPDWDAYFDFVVYVTAWNSSLDAFAATHANELLGSDAPLEWLLLNHMEAVCRVQLDRRIPRSLWEVDGVGLRDLLRDEVEWGRVRSVRQQTIGELMRKLYGTGLPANAHIRDKDFVTWVDRDLPRAADRLCCTESVSDWLLSARREAVLVGGDLERANRVAAASLARRIRGRLRDRCWGSTIDILRHLDASLAESVELEWRIAQENLAAEFNSTVDRLAEAGLPRVLAKRLREEGLTSETADALLAAGVSSELVQTLRARYLVRSPAEPESTQTVTDPRGNRDTAL